MGIFQQFPYSNFHESNLDQIIEIMREMQDEWANTKSEWASYKDFIDNYFANLNLDEETEKALRRLVADGTLDPVIDPVIIAQVTAWLEEHITQPTVPAIDTSLTIAGAAADAKATGDAINDLKSDLNNTTSGVTKLADNSYSRTSIAYTGYDMDRALTETGKEVLNGSVILSFPVTAGSFIKVNLINRTGGDILYFFQDTQNVPWDSNAHIIGNIHRGSRFVGYLFVPTGATYLVTNGDTANLNSYVYNVGSYLPMKYYGQLSSGNYTDTEAGVYAVNRVNVSGLPSEMSQDYGWLICYVKNNLYALIESNTPKTIWLKVSPLKRNGKTTLTS